MSSSLYGDSVDKNFLPNLPGFRSKAPTCGKKYHFFQIVNGSVIEKDGMLPVGNGEMMDDASVNSIGNTVAYLSKHQHGSRTDLGGLTLTFQVYFEMTKAENSDVGQVRKCNLYYFVEDGTLKVVEKPQLNSGVSQGTLVRRAVIPKEDGTPITVADLVVGQELVLYGRSFK
jgi:hypothetical protein